MLCTKWTYSHAKQLHSYSLAYTDSLTHFGELLLYVCMYLMIGKGQIAQKRPNWGKNRLKS